MTRNDRRTRTMAISAVFLVILASSGTFLVAAADAGMVEVNPSGATIEVGETKTFEIVASDLGGEIGAGEVAVHVSDANVATVTDIKIQGDPGLSNVSTNADNSTVEMLYALADADETDTVTIAEVTVMGESNGMIEISARSIERNDQIRLFDDEGKSYGTFGTNPGRVTVEAADSSSDSTGSGNTGSPDAGTDEELPSDGKTDTEPKADGTDQPGADDGTSTDSDERDADSDQDMTRTDNREFDDGSPPEDDEPVDQTGFGIVPAAVGIVLATYLANRRTR